VERLTPASADDLPPLGELIAESARIGTRHHRSRQRHRHCGRGRHRRPPASSPATHALAAVLFPGPGPASEATGPGFGPPGAVETGEHLRSVLTNEITDAFLSSPRYANPNIRRGYTGVLNRLLAGLGASRPLAEVSGEELAGLLEQLRGRRAPATWNRNRGAVAAWLSWCAASRLPAPVLPASPGRRREHPKRHPRGTPARDRPGAVPPGCAAAGEDPVADAVPDRRPGQRGAGAEHRRPRPGRPAAPRSAPRAATPNRSAGAPAPRTCCPASPAAATPGPVFGSERRPAPTSLHGPAPTAGDTSGSKASCSSSATGSAHPPSAASSRH
jgi:hypothetical protein